jgi:glucose 1-dehydrogenase
MKVNSMNYFSVAGRRALVTGATEGIGLASALALANHGAELIIHGLPSPEAEEARRRLNEIGAHAELITADLSDQSGLAAVAKAAQNVDLFVSCVATQVVQDLGCVNEEAMDAQYALNVKAFITILQAALPRMRKQRWGRIITIGSVQEARPHPQMIIYAGLKAAQENFVRNIAMQVASDGITVNNIAPGIILTSRSKPFLSDRDYAASRLTKIPAGAFGEPEDVAGAVVLLASEAGRYITGASIPVDGGMRL